ncbi:MAG TPA: glutamyl-tRNA reductase [Gemmatimonadaceae bacterium]|nr:glutamyl-tRNA reductase [Gemmatimonadaceae bacterium]
MGVTVVGVSHATAPIAVRERLVYDADEVAPALRVLHERPGVREAVLLSTCNRTELYVVADEGTPVQEAVLALFGERLGEPVGTHAFVHHDKHAVAHLFRVASGMDSMILGEAQIHGQVRRAWELGRAFSGAVLNRLFQTALLVGSRVRTETALGRGAASVSSAAVKLARQIFGSLTGRRAMVLGAGEMAELALECLMSEGVRAAVVANRSYERAAELAARHGAVAVHYDACWNGLADIDVLLCSTSAPHPVVTAARLRQALRSRGGRPLCVLDIALPRDVEPAVGQLDHVYLYDLDDLRAVATASLERRRQELPSAEQVVADETQRFWEWVAGLSAVPVLTEMRAQMDGLRERELAQMLRRLPALSEADRATIEHFSRTLMNKFLHHPTVRLRAAAANGRGLGVVDAARYLFALGESADHAPAADGADDPAAPRPEER